MLFTKMSNLSILADVSSIWYISFSNSLNWNKNLKARHFLRKSSFSSPVSNYFAFYNFIYSLISETNFLCLRYWSQIPYLKSLVRTFKWIFFFSFYDEVSIVGTDSRILEMSYNKWVNCKWSSCWWKAFESSDMLWFADILNKFNNNYK